MPIQLLCPCGNTVQIPDQKAGQQVRCPDCCQVLTAPGSGLHETPSAPPPAQPKVRTGTKPATTSKPQTGHKPPVGSSVTMLPTADASPQANRTMIGVPAGGSNSNTANYVPPPTNKTMIGVPTDGSNPGAASNRQPTGVSRNRSTQTGAVRQTPAAAAPPRSSMLPWLICGALGLMVLLCVAVGAGAYVIMTQRSGPALAGITVPGVPPTEPVPPTQPAPVPPTKPVEPPKFVPPTKPVPPANPVPPTKPAATGNGGGPGDGAKDPKIAQEAKRKQEALAKLEKNLTAAKDASKDVRLKAATELVKALNDTDDTIRRKAAQGLSEMGLEAKDALPALTRLEAKDPDEAVRNTARNALEKVNVAVTAESERVATLIKDLKAKDAKTRLAAAQKLSEMGADAKEAREPLVEMMVDTTPAISVGGSEALEKIDVEFQKHVVTLIIGQDKQTALTAIRAMGAEGKAAMPALQNLYQSLRAGRGNPPPLGRGFGSPPPADPVMVLGVAMTVGGDDKRVSTMLHDALTAAPPAVATPAQKSSYSFVRASACSMVNKSKMDAKEKTTALLVAVEDLRATMPALQALSEIGPDAAAAIPLLKKLKLSPDDSLRAAATDALSKIDK